jgi:ornithine cyclodeaminase
MRILNPEQTRVALPMQAAIQAMRAAFGDDRETPLRVMLGSSLFMPGRVGTTSGIKVVSTVPGNPAGIVIVFGADGGPLGAVDGPTLTAIRTAAGAGLATDLLADPSAETMAMLGAGAMAADQIEAIRSVRPITGVRIWSRDIANARSLASAVGGSAVATAEEAVRGAEVITTATPARRPLFDARWVASGAHVNAIGAFTPEMCELPPELVREAFVAVDDVEAAAAEAGDLIQAGVHPDATIGDLLAGRISAGRGATVFKSVGIASQDVAAAAQALERAAELGIGIEV